MAASSRCADGLAEKRAREEAEAAEVSARAPRETPKMGRRGRPRGAPDGAPRGPAPAPPGASARARQARPPQRGRARQGQGGAPEAKRASRQARERPEARQPRAAPSGADAARKTALARALEVAAAAKSAKPAAATASAAPRALRLNAAGEEIDEDGNVIVAKVREVSTFKVNEKTNKLEEFAALERAAEAEAAAEADDLAWMDPRMGAAGRRRQRKGGFQVRERFPCPSRLDAIVRLGSGSPLWFSVRILSKPCGRRRARRASSTGGLQRCEIVLRQCRAAGVGVLSRPRLSALAHLPSSRFSRRATRLDSQVTLCREDSSFLVAIFMLATTKSIGSWRRGIPHERNPLPSGQHLPRLGHFSSTRALEFSPSDSPRFAPTRRRMKFGNG